MSNELTEYDDPGDLISSDSIIELANNAERRIEAVKKIKSLALRVTNSNDWQDEGGKPYLWVSGAEKVARLFNISWRFEEVETEEHDDGHFTFTFKGFFSVGGKTIESIGTRSSRDAFFSRAHGKDIEPGKISRGNVKKAAMTNCIGGGVCRLLGIRNMTWEELEAAGIKRGGGTAVNRTGVPMCPKWGEFAGQPLAECNDEWLHRYGDFVSNALDIGEKMAIEKDDIVSIKKEKRGYNAAIDKKLQFQAQNQKLFNAILDEVDRRKTEQEAR